MLVICLLTWWLARLLRTQTALSDSRVTWECNWCRGNKYGGPERPPRRPALNPNGVSGSGSRAAWHPPLLAERRPPSQRGCRMQGVQSTFPSPGGEGRVRGQSLRGSKGRSNLLCARRGWLGPGLTPRTRPSDPTSDSRSGDRPELARTIPSGSSRTWQR